LRTITFDESKWQLVPKKPTFLMIEAGCEHSDCEEIYEAMLTISPPPDEAIRDQCPEGQLRN
jgi:hypothetical protein